VRGQGAGTIVVRGSKPGGIAASVMLSITETWRGVAWLASADGASRPVPT
jgi:hypothetical protein